MRHVPEEKDKVRWQAACMHPLHQLQDRMHIYAGREEEAASQGVSCRIPPSSAATPLTRASAKYIEGLENRLARMESLMRLSGVLPDDDDGSTDLATLEKRLADRAAQAGTPTNRPSDERRSSAAQPAHKAAATPVQPGLPSPRSGTTSPEPPTNGSGDKEEDALAEMMCSLVTNNCGETRYIGKHLIPSMAQASCGC